MWLFIDRVRKMLDHVFDVVKRLGVVGDRLR